MISDLDYISLVDVFREIDDEASLNNMTNHVFQKSTEEDQKEEFVVYCVNPSFSEVVSEASATLFLRVVLFLREITRILNEDCKVDEDEKTNTADSDNGNENITSPFEDLNISKWEGHCSNTRNDMIVWKSESLASVL